MLEQHNHGVGHSDRTRDDADTAGRYIDEVGATPLLTAAEEIDYAKRIEAGLYAGELLRRDAEGEDVALPGSRDELRAVAEQGRRAKEHMVQANLRLVISTAKKYSHLGLPFLDVVQEGNLGLIRAVEKFDYARGYKFSTYAMWWIRQSMSRGVADKARTVRLPAKVGEEISKLANVERTLQVELGREPTDEEIADSGGTDAQRVAEVRRLGREPVSLDGPVGEDGDTSIADFIEDTQTPDAVESAERGALDEELRAVLDDLPNRQAEVVRRRYGLRGGRPQTLQEIASGLGLHRERVRQLEKEALAALRRPERREPLLEWAG